MKIYLKPQSQIVELKMECLVALSLQDGNGEANPDIGILSTDCHPVESSNYWHHSWED